MLEQSMQVEALRLLAAWWDSSRPTLDSWRRRAMGTTAAGGFHPKTPGWPQGTRAVTGPTSAAR